jgi:hypothetical protein
MNSEETAPSLACESTRRFENHSVEMVSEIGLLNQLVGSAVGMEF